MAAPVPSFSFFTAHMKSTPVEEHVITSMDVLLFKAWLCALPFVIAFCVWQMVRIGREQKAKNEARRAAFAARLNKLNDPFTPSSHEDQP